jgi:hypothetical protein
MLTQDDRMYKTAFETYVTNSGRKGGDRLTTEGYKTALEEKGWTVAQLARRLRESRPRVSTAINHPDAGAFRIQKRVCAALDLDYDGPEPIRKKKLRKKKEQAQ